MAVRSRACRSVVSPAGKQLGGRLALPCVGRGGGLRQLVGQALVLPFLLDEPVTGLGQDCLQVLGVVGGLGRGRVGLGPLCLGPSLLLLGSAGSGGCGGDSLGGLTGYRLDLCFGRLRVGECAQFLDERRELFTDVLGHAGHLTTKLARALARGVDRPVVARHPRRLGLPAPGPPGRGTGVPGVAAETAKADRCSRVRSRSAVGHSPDSGRHASR